ncbi:DUF7681 family protein [Chryseobacterium arthrosphaerae]|uniref:Acb2/Tad1 domain-containing protein n=1 Tax=Chryseobacterium arthrosphaerae TaxID=651561 RepID=UPI00241C8F17|nr:hypothetical protein [Chryseobacterium arthrosphaerae]
MSEKSFGEKRVRVEFNPSNAGNVTALKTKAAEAINILEDFKNDPRESIDGETARLVSTAQTKFEEAAMWAVKAVTK